MTWEPRPVPPVTPETEDFWSAAAAGRLTLGECHDCDEVFYYPRGHCPFCFSDDVGLTDAAGTGEVYSYTVSGRIAGWPDEHLPVVIAYVELDEGPRMITHVVDCDPAAVEVGSAVAVDFVPTEEPDVAVPVFRLAGGEH